MTAQLLTNRRGSGRTRAIEDARSSRRHKVRTCAHKVRGDNGSGVVKLGCEEKLVPGNLDKLTREREKKSDRRRCMNIALPEDKSRGLFG